MLKAKEIRSMNEADLAAKVQELKKQLLKDYAQIARGTSIKNSGQIRAAKRTIARIYTIINEKTKTGGSKKE